MSRDDIAFLSAAELLAAYRARELSPVEVAQATLERIERLDPVLNAYLTVDREGALNAAREAGRRWAQSGEKPLLCGVPVSIKDLLYTTWLPTTHGSLWFKDYYHPTNSPAVDRMLAAGAVITGKTNTPEFGLLDITRNRLRDDCRNPWDLDRSAGGSSGGAGAAVAAGLAPLAIGTDGAGSIRIPAFYCGVFGLKPTFGRIPHDGWKGAPSTSHQGPMTRTVRDAALIMQALSGPDARDALSLQETPPDFLEALQPRVWAGTRVAMSLDFGYIETDPELQQAVLDAAQLLRGLGCEVIESHPPRIEWGPDEEAMTPADEYAYAMSIKPDLEEHIDELTPYGKRTMEQGREALAWKHSRTVRKRTAWAAQVRDWFQQFEFLLSPVMGRMAPRCDEQRHLGDGEPWPGMFLPPFNAAGSPAASIPFGHHSTGLPLAVQLVGRFGDDAGVLRLSAAIEAAHPWADRWPPIATEVAAARSPQRTTA